MNATSNNIPSGSAIVIGSGMGGLLAARALSERFASVVVLERDDVNESRSPRKGVPQARQVHALLARGASELEHLFPGLLEQIIAEGGLSDDGMEVVKWHQGGGYHAPAVLGIRGAACSRSFLEALIRDRVREIGNVEIRGGMSVDGLLWNEQMSRVTGVRIRNHVNVASSVQANLVVDSSGRGSRLAAWLEEAGYESPDESTVPAEIRYVTRQFDRRNTLGDGNIVHVAVPDHMRPRGGFAIAVENDRWMVGLTGRRGEQPPLDLDGFRSYAQTLGIEAITDIVSSSEPLDDGAAYSFRTSWFRRYHRMKRFPTGVIPFADAICSFNPVYGQGMTVAAIEANALRRVLMSERPDLERRFLAEIAPAIESAWTMISGNDLRCIPRDAGFSRPQRFQYWYLDRLHVAARTDSRVARAFGSVVHMVKAPQTLMTPSIAVRVLIHGHTRRATRGERTEKTALHNVTEAVRG